MEKSIYNNEVIVIDGHYYKNPRFPTLDDEESQNTEVVDEIDIQNISFLELLRRNKKKKIIVSYSDAKVFEGILDQIGNDFFVIKNDNQVIVLLLCNVVYIELIDTINYKNVLE